MVAVVVPPHHVVLVWLGSDGTLQTGKSWGSCCNRLRHTYTTTPLL